MPLAAFAFLAGLPIWDRFVGRMRLPRWPGSGSEERNTGEQGLSCWQGWLLYESYGAQC